MIEVPQVITLLPMKAQQIDINILTACSLYVIPKILTYFYVHVNLIFKITDLLIM